MSKNFGNIQAEQKEWSVRNFGAHDHKYRPLLGVIEELGEFYEATTMGAKDAALDAVGDVVVYMCDVCNQWGWDLNALYEARLITSNADWPIARIQGKLAHHQLKYDQNIRKGEHHESQLLTLMKMVLYRLDESCEFMNVELTEVVQSVWDQVRQRSWVENPDNAHEVAGG